MIKDYINVRQVIPTEVQLEVIYTRLNEGKIQAIKLLRERMGNVGLREAKDWVDEFDAQCRAMYCEIPPYALSTLGDILKGKL